MAVLAAAIWTAAAGAQVQTGGPPQGRGATSDSRPTETSQPRRAGSGFEWEWWKDKELGLPPELSKRIDDIYQSRMHNSRRFAEELAKEADVLNSMVLNRSVSVEEFQIQANKMENLRSRVNESRWVMAYRMYQALSPEQYKKLNELREARARRRSQGRGGLAPGR